MGWAMFLACSWTWCIGMFLPVLLLRDAGTAGYLIFAVPNVIGAAAMGWVLHTGRASRQVVERHRAACVAFSFVTVAFHWFFLGWFGVSLGEWTGIGAGAAPLVTVGAIVVAVLWAVFLLRERGRVVKAAAGLWGVSAVVLAVFLFTPESAMPRTQVSLTAGRDAFELLGFAAVSVLGFACCPYLDLTFHAARQACDARGAKLAFGMGFGVFFLAMILLTWIYAGVFLPALSGTAAHVSGAHPDGSEGASGVVRGSKEWIVVLIGVHVLMQSVYTMVVHGKSARGLLREHGTTTGPMVWLGLMFGALALGCVSAWLPAYAGLRFGELIYRVFMSSYGLVFPAYVVLCVVPARHERLDPAWARVMGARRVGWWILAVVIAAPVYWAGFIERRMEWLALGAAIIFAARVLMPRRV